MMNLQDKKTLIIIAVFVLVLLGGGFYVLSAKKSQPQSTTQPQMEEETVEMISPEELGLTITVRADKKALSFVMTNVDDVETVDSQYSYIAKGDLPRGGLLNDLRPENGKIETKTIDLGSCSSGRCKYDEGVEDVTFTFKVTKKNGKVYSAEKKVTL